VFKILIWNFGGLVGSRYEIIFPDLVPDLAKNEYDRFYNNFTVYAILFFEAGLRIRITSCNLKLKKIYSRVEKHLFFLKNSSKKSKIVKEKEITSVTFERVFQFISGYTDSSFHFNADPDQTFHFNPGPDRHQSDENLRPLVILSLKSS
jgi:hypothetical protein